MSLDDQFNKNDGSFIDNLDSALFNFNKKIATKWQDKTYRSKKDLEKVLYLGSAAAIGGYAINTSSLFAGILAGAVGLKGVSESRRPRSSKHEEMSMEAIGLPLKTAKYLNVIIYGLGAVETLAGAGSLIAGAVTGNNEFYMDSINHLSFGLGTLGWISADYMAKSDIGTPPPKPKKKPVLDIARESLGGIFPQPSSKPVPVKVYTR